MKNSFLLILILHQKLTKIIIIVVVSFQSAVHILNYQNFLTRGSFNFDHLFTVEAGLGITSYFRRAAISLETFLSIT